eukprot:765983-Hanusia_phi.AAC.5
MILFESAAESGPTRRPAAARRAAGSHESRVKPGRLSTVSRTLAGPVGHGGATVKRCRTGR